MKEKIERNNYLKHKKYEDYNTYINEILYKKCKVCGEWLEANLNNFGKDKSKKDGLNENCRICRYKERHENHLLNKDKYKENIAKKIANNKLYNSKFNDYIVEEDITKIIMKTINDESVITIIDTEELERVKSFGLRWCIKNAKNTGTKYARATRWEMVNGEPKLITYCLHILLMDVNKGEYVDHKDHDTLNNRKENLRITTNENNTKNRKGKNSNNTSGYRNVMFNKQTDRWMVRLQINKKAKTLGEFQDVHEAGKFAEEMRQKYYGEFAGKS